MFLRCGSMNIKHLRSYIFSSTVRQLCLDCGSVNRNITRVSFLRHPHHVRHRSFDGNALSGELPSNFCYLVGEQLATCSLGGGNFSCPSYCASEVRW